MPKSIYSFYKCILHFSVYNIACFVPCGSTRLDDWMYIVNLKLLIILVYPYGKDMKIYNLSKLNNDRITLSHKRCHTCGRHEILGSFVACEVERKNILPPSLRNMSFGFTGFNV